MYICGVDDVIDWLQDRLKDVKACSQQLRLSWQHC
jgi:hypothetical protein